jgi:hypothetical protein
MWLFVCLPCLPACLLPAIYLTARVCLGGWIFVAVGGCGVFVGAIGVVGLFMENKPEYVTTWLGEC